MGIEEFLLDKKVRGISAVGTIIASCEGGYSLSTGEHYSCYGGIALAQSLSILYLMRRALDDSKGFKTQAALLSCSFASFITITTTSLYFSVEHNLSAMHMTNMAGFATATSILAYEKYSQKSDVDAKIQKSS